MQRLRKSIEKNIDNSYIKLFQTTEKNEKNFKSIQWNYLSYTGKTWYKMYDPLLLPSKNTTLGQLYKEKNYKWNISKLNPPLY